MIHTYKITIWSQFINAWSIVLYFAVLYALAYYQIEVKGFDLGPTLALYILAFLAQFIPLTIIHLNYYTVNKGDSIVYDSEKKEICFKSKKGDLWFKVYEIRQVTRYISYRFGKGAQILAWDSYNHSIIELMDGKKIIITSLLIPNLQLPIDKNRIVIEKAIFRLAHRTNFENFEVDVNGG